MTLLIRTVEDSDLVAVGALHHRSRTTAYAGLVSSAALSAGSPAAMGEWWTERWRWEQDTHRMSVASSGGLLIGFSYVGPSETPGMVELAAIHVEPDSVGTGVGRALMIAALADLAAIAEPGTDRAMLWVLTANAHARRFYERGGWTVNAETREAPMGPELVPQVRYSHPL